MSSVGMRWLRGDKNRGSCNTVGQTLQLDSGVVKEIAVAQSVEQAWLVLLPIIQNAGFDHALYGTNRLRGTSVFGEQADSFLISDCPKDFLEAFWTDGLYRRIPVSRWIMQNSGPLSLRFGSNQYHAGALSGEEESSQRTLMETGVTSGYAIGYNRNNSAVVSGFGLINFGKSQEQADDDWELNGPVIEAYCHVFRLRAASLPVPIKHKTLTLRQQEVLKWVGSGKTTSEVATILGLSSAAIEKHLKRVREILNVSTTTQAVLHAQLNSQIFSMPREER